MQKHERMHQNKFPNAPFAASSQARRQEDGEKYYEDKKGGQEGYG